MCHLNNNMQSLSHPRLPESPTPASSKGQAGKHIEITSSHGRRECNPTGLRHALLVLVVTRRQRPYSIVMPRSSASAMVSTSPRAVMTCEAWTQSSSWVAGSRLALTSPVPVSHLAERRLDHCWQKVPAVLVLKEFCGLPGQLAADQARPRLFRGRKEESDQQNFLRWSRRQAGRENVPPGGELELDRVGLAAKGAAAALLDAGAAEAVAVAVGAGGAADVGGRGHGGQEGGDDDEELHLEGSGGEKLERGSWSR